MMNLFQSNLYDNYIPSDRSLKSDIVELDDEKSLKFIFSLEAKSFIFNGHDSIGFVAQDVEVINKHCVIESVPRERLKIDKSFLSLSYVDIFVHTTNATKYLSKQVNALIELVERLEQKVIKLEEAK